MADVLLRGEFLRGSRGFTFGDSTGVTWTFDSATNKLTLAITAGAVGSFDEAVDDRVAVLIQNGTGISWSYDDGANTLTPTVSLAVFSTTDLAEGSNLYFTDERAQDAVGTILLDSSSVNFTYDDGANTITAAVITSADYTWSGAHVFNVGADAATTVVIGESTTARGNSQDGKLILYGEQTSTIVGVTFAMTGANLQISSTASIGVQFLGGNSLYVYDSGNTKSLSVANNGTNAVLNTSGLTGLILQAASTSAIELTSTQIKLDLSILLNKVISPTALAANTDNWNPTGLPTCNIIRASASSAFNLTGITALTTGTVILLENVGANTITLKHDVTSTAANRFYCPGSVDFALTANKGVWVHYDGTSSRWRVIG